MEQNNLEQIKNLETECEKIKEGIDEINRQREAQDDAFERELEKKRKKLSKIQQTIGTCSVSILEAAFPKYFKIGDLDEDIVVIFKTGNISFKGDKFVAVVDKLRFSRYGDTKTEFSIYKKPDSWSFDNLDELLTYIKNNIQELTEEEYDECKKKIFEMASNLM